MTSFRKLSFIHAYIHDLIPKQVYHTLSPSLVLLMAFSKLRQRKAGSATLLPQHRQDLLLINNKSRRKKGGRGRRRRRRVSLVSLTCIAMVVSIVVLLLFGESVPTSHPVLHQARNFTKHHVQKLLLHPKPGPPGPAPPQTKPPFPTVPCGGGVGNGNNKDASNNTGYLNDNYCDCLDTGADEPDTDACAHVTVGKPTFSCHNNNNNTTMVIFASRVRDGVPDCPNGSDEL